MKKRLEDIFYLLVYGVNDLSHLVLLIIFETINVLMSVEARHDASTDIRTLIVSNMIKRTRCDKSLTP